MQLVWPRLQSTVVCLLIPKPETVKVYKGSQITILVPIEEPTMVAAAVGSGEPPFWQGEVSHKKHGDVMGNGRQGCSRPWRKRGHLCFICY